MKRIISIFVILFTIISCFIASTRVYTYTDLENCREYIFNQQYNRFYDYNKDGRLTMSDLIKIRNNILERKIY